ncbi:MAG: 50S ribosomal protein L2 [Zestosphaera tikiterensis]|uniref:Large ribosomal subunit protein uL2 n=1 Tax=Zestosphaera tikiterensis TaxID=1973259 RepID=A0A2R7Y7C1_9CREN|nr:MAG: 50S ribosomal protein L2 [Zestosphaera tikiterensis]
MGKKTLQQRAGRGGQNFRSPGHLHPAPAKYPPPSEHTLTGVVMEFIHDPGRWVPLARIQLENGVEYYIPAAEGMYVGQKVSIGPDAPPLVGNTLPLGKIPEGTKVYNIELNPGDGGKLARQAGSYALVLGRSGNYTIVLLPSKKQRPILSTARATVGVPAGAGRIEKPLLKAGAAYHKWKVKAHKWPRVRGVAMNAVSHKFGGGIHQRKSHPSTVSRNAPPGRKVGHIAARRTGLKKR